MPFVKDTPMTREELYKAWGAWRKGAITPGAIAVAIKRTSGYVTNRWPKLQKFISRMEKVAASKAKKKVSGGRSGRPPGGRKFADNPYMRAEVIRMAAVAGYTLDKLAAFIGCSTHTLTNYLREHPDLKQALDNGRKDADLRVVNALYARAKGTTIKAVKHATYKGIISDSVEYDVELPPDVEAAKFWLVNRDNENWSRAPAGATPDNEQTEYDIREGLYDENETEH